MSEQRTCPKCDRRYSAGVTYCPEDGAPLCHSGADPLLGATLSGGVKVLSLCGKGSMGTVYRAWQSDMEREVAVKVLRRELAGDTRIVKRFYREARAVARLNHPHIVTLHAVASTHEGHPFLLMEFVRGAHLGQICNESAPLPAVRAIHICRQITSALSEAHANGVVHRDLKPANIVVTDTRNLHDFVKVLDFGVAKILFDEGDARLTQTGAIFGTPHFIAPEQASGEGPDHRSDIYSLGVVLFRMITGRLPFDSADGMEVLVQHIKQDPPLPRDIVPGVPLRLQEVVLRALAKTPSARWQSADDFGVALQRVYEELRRWQPDTRGGQGTTAPLPSADPSPHTVPRNASPTATAPSNFTPLNVGTATQRASAPISAVPHYRQPAPSMSTQALGRQLRGRPTSRRRTLALAGTLLTVTALAAALTDWQKATQLPEPQPGIDASGSADGTLDAGVTTPVRDTGLDAPAYEARPQPRPTTIKRSRQAQRRPHRVARDARDRRPRARRPRHADATANDTPATVGPLGPDPTSEAKMELGDHGSSEGRLPPPTDASPEPPTSTPSHLAPSREEEQQHERVD